MSHHEDEYCGCGCDCYFPQLLVGKQAPDFALPGYQKGKFCDITLSDLKGKWVVLFFYPADFTFV